MSKSTGKNSNLHSAKKEKNDEFYTQLSDIEKELRSYTHHFKDKVVYCNCDDPQASNFAVYFLKNFKHLGLKKFIATCYRHEDKDLLAFDDKVSNEAVYYVYDGNGRLDDVIDDDELKKQIKPIPLKGDGDFRSDECIELLKQADIVVTNPPFSLFREYISQIMEHDKKFLVIGNQNAITYKDVFALIRDNKMWLGTKSGDMKFIVPDYYEVRTHRSWKDEDGTNWRSLGNACWFTNLDHPKRHEKIELYDTYKEEKYPHYDDYDAINVSKVADIPKDFTGKMGVPITFLDKYNPTQFEILGIDRYIEDNPNYGKRFSINGKEVYARIIIKNKTND